MIDENISDIEAINILNENLIECENEMKRLLLQNNSLFYLGDKKNLKQTKKSIYDTKQKLIDIEKEIKKRILNFKIKHNIE